PSLPVSLCFHVLTDVTRALRNIGLARRVLHIGDSMQRQIVNHRRIALSAVVILLSAALQPTAKGANQYAKHNLISDFPGLADQTDPNLVNPWGISMSSTSPFWISNNHSGVAAVYNGQGQPTPAASPIVVRIPVPSGDAHPAAPTGQVFNDTTGFNV